MKAIFSVLFLFMTASISTCFSSKAQIPMKFPPKLIAGDTIALISPASSQRTETIDSAISVLRTWGLVAECMPHAKGRNFGSYPAADDERLADLIEAFSNPKYKAILCTRGGYGCNHLIEHVDRRIIANNPKWLIGYSDISALHALMRSAGVASIHGPMTSHIVSEPDSDTAVVAMKRILFEGLPVEYGSDPAPYDHFGSATGRLVGGNLMVLNGLSGSQFDMLDAGKEEPVILFIEDVSEKIYAIERVLIRLHLSGVLDRVDGIIIGQFTDYERDDNFSTMESMIYTWLQRWGYYDKPNFPIAFNSPVGHVTKNYPLVEGAMSTLTVNHDGASLLMKAE